MRKRFDAASACLKRDAGVQASALPDLSYLFAAGVGAGEDEAAGAAVGAGAAAGVDASPAEGAVGAAGASPEAAAAGLAEP